MTGAAETTVAVLAALAVLAACSFGVGVAVQHRQVQLPSTARGRRSGSWATWPGGG